MDKRHSVASMIAMTDKDDPALNVWMSVAHLQIGDLNRIANYGLGIDIDELRELQPCANVSLWLSRFSPEDIQRGFEKAGYHFNYPMSLVTDEQKHVGCSCHRNLEDAKFRLLVGNIRVDQVPLTYLLKSAILSSFRKLTGAIHAK